MLRTISCLLVQISTHSHLLPGPDNNQHTWGTQEETAKSCLLMHLKLVKITTFLLVWSWHNYMLFTGMELSHTVTLILFSWLVFCNLVQVPLSCTDMSKCLPRTMDLYEAQQQNKVAVGMPHSMIDKVFSFNITNSTTVWDSSMPVNSLQLCHDHPSKNIVIFTNFKYINRHDFAVSSWVPHVCWLLSGSGSKWECVEICTSKHDMVLSTA